MPSILHGPNERHEGCYDQPAEVVVVVGGMAKGVNNLEWNSQFQGILSCLPRDDEIISMPHFLDVKSTANYVVPGLNRRYTSYPEACELRCKYKERQTQLITIYHSEQMNSVHFDYIVGCICGYYVCLLLVL